MRKFVLPLLCVSIVLLPGCALKKRSANVADPKASLSSLQNLSYSRHSARHSGVTSAIRIQGLEEVALSTGAQSGLAWRSKHINAKLTHDARMLDQSFNFMLLILNHDILPPVLAEGRQTLKLNDPSTLRISDRTFRILKQARFTTTPPNWRNYVWMSYSKPETPDQSLLPKTSAERAIWKSCVEQGWKNGVKQANTIFRDNLARLRQDYRGMILYRKLLAQGMVSAPYVARTAMGVTGDGNQIHINDQVLRITALPQLNTDSKTWKPAITQNEYVAPPYTAHDAQGAGEHGMRSVSSPQKGGKFTAPPEKSGRWQQLVNNQH